MSRTKHPHHTHTRTQGVLAGAYRGRGVERTLLSHLVYLVEQGTYPGPEWDPGPHTSFKEVGVGCRVNPDHIADADPETCDARPTCATCARKWDSLRAAR